ncbi:MAG: hypothetical protein ACRD2A_17540, partial [Vicinamibacterales bacterium]
AVDYVRYLEAPFKSAEYLRRRSEKTLPAAFNVLTRINRLPRFVVGAVIGVTRTIERLVRCDRDVERFLRAMSPNAVFVSPLVTLGPSSARQTEVVKAARALRMPIMVGVASWDHLTSKGLIRIAPDALAVWNQAQADEAVSLHRVPRSRVVVTGAQSLDHWFEPVPSYSMSQLRVQLGIAPGRRVILFVGSSRNMAPGSSEVRFVHRWVAALRAASSEALRNAVVIVRPHPTNTEPWRGDPPAGVVVHPREYSGIPLSDDEVEVFRRSILASDVVVGINTTAMIEAAILQRPVLSVRDEEFLHSQAGTLHFDHLPIEAGGCTVVAATLDEHVQQLESALSNPGPHVAAGRTFTHRFVRPLGIDEPATQHLCNAIERVAGGGAHAPAVVSRHADASVPSRIGPADA